MGKAAQFLYIKKYCCFCNQTFTNIINNSVEQVIAVTVVSGRNSFALCSLYSPPGILPKCINVLCNITDFISANFENVCFAGEYSPVLSDFIDFILLHSLTQVVTSSTKGNDVLNLILCSQFLMHSFVSYIPPFSNNYHSSLELQIFVEQVNSISNNIEYYYDFSHGDCENFNTYMNSIDWPNLLNSVGEEGDILVNFMHIFSIELDKFIPIPVKTCLSNYKDYPAYIKRILGEKQTIMEK